MNSVTSLCGGDSQHLDRKPFLDSSGVSRDNAGVCRSSLPIAVGRLHWREKPLERQRTELIKRSANVSDVSRLGKAHGDVEPHTGKSLMNFLTPLVDVAGGKCNIVAPAVL